MKLSVAVAVLCAVGCSPPSRPPIDAGVTRYDFAGPTNRIFFVALPEMLFVMPAP